MPKGTRHPIPYPDITIGNWYHARFEFKAASEQSSASSAPRTRIYVLAKIPHATNPSHGSAICLFLTSFGDRHRPPARARSTNRNIDRPGRTRQSPSRSAHCTDSCTLPASTAYRLPTPGMRPSCTCGKPQKRTRPSRARNGRWDISAAWKLLG